MFVGLGGRYRLEWSFKVRIRRTGFLWKLWEVIGRGKVGEWCDCFGEIILFYGKEVEG